MNRFHSIGTPSANVEVMWAWKMIIPITAIVPIVPPRETISTSGRPNSTAVPRCAPSEAARPGRRSSGPLPVQLRLRPARAVPRRVAHHHRDHVREVAVQLGRRRAPPDEEDHELPADEQVVRREQRDQEQEPVHLGAGGQERDLVAQPEERPEREQHRDGRRVQPPGRRPGHRLPARDQQVHARGEHAGVQRHVDERAPEAAGQRHLVRPRGQAHHARPEPVQDPADDRARSGRSSCIEPDPRPRISQSSVHTANFWKTIGSVHQCADVAQAAQAGRGGRDDGRRADDVDDQLDRVEQEDDVGRAEAVDRPVLAVGLQAGEVRLGPPLLEIERRRCGLEEAHQEPIRTRALNGCRHGDPRSAAPAASARTAVRAGERGPASVATKSAASLALEAISHRRSWAASPAAASVPARVPRRGPRASGRPLARRLSGRRHQPTVPRRDQARRTAWRRSAPARRRARVRRSAPVLPLVGDATTRRTVRAIRAWLPPASAGTARPGCRPGPRRGSACRPCR